MAHWFQEVRRHPVDVDRDCCGDELFLHDVEEFAINVLEDTSEGLMAGWRCVARCLTKICGVIVEWCVVCVGLRGKMGCGNCSDCYSC